MNALSMFLLSSLLQSIFTFSSAKRTQCLHYFSLERHNPNELTQTFLTLHLSRISRQWQELLITSPQSQSIFLLWNVTHSSPFQLRSTEALRYMFKSHFLHIVCLLPAFKCAHRSIEITLHPCCRKICVAVMSALRVDLQGALLK